MHNCKITVTKYGPYLVQGSVPLVEKLIISSGGNYKYADGRELPQSETYTLCRCGRSKKMPFCDGSHTHFHFEGTETASKQPFINQAEIIEGYDFDLLDVEKLCAFARFCHRASGDAWSLTEESENSLYREEAIKAACDCPAGRLVIVDRQTGKQIEPDYEPSIVIIQDPERQCSGPVWVRGGIPVISSDGYPYEIRNRITLCRCGKSMNKPFCDAMHVMIGFNDSEQE